MTIQDMPIDPGRLRNVRLAVGAEPRADFNTGEVRTDRETGLPVYRVAVLVKPETSRKAYVLEIDVPGEPQGLVEGEPVQLHDLTISTWEREGRSGETYRASAVTPAIATTPPATATASATATADASATSAGSGRVSG